ncbi:glycosyltransferase [Roseomonas sp. E05]|uniref:glycosyltransferase n=1 Tax=Roseomonas sp. E05 TaxID=3046310 RepID=UPI0024BA76CA|nr:glycosyltransferase [Roseomonas sp. E05]MDJ0391570.1 glycosyltransferase [Roseomonas sp. E05]
MPQRGARAGRPQPAGGACWPQVSLHLPLQDASPVEACATLDALDALDYPALEVLVVDTSTTPAAWEPVAEHCARLGPRFRFFHLGCRAGERMAALNFALKETSPAVEVIGTLEAGCALHAGWLRHTAPLLARPGLGFVQGAWTTPGPDAPTFERFAAASRPAALPAAAVTLRPSLALIRAEALRLAGGWAESAADQHAELGLRLQRQGWEAVQMVEPLGCPPLPADLSAWGAAQVAAARSDLDLLRRHADVLLNPLHPGLSSAQRRYLLGHMLPGLTDLLWMAVCGFGVMATLLLLPLRNAALLPATPLLLLAALLMGGRAMAALGEARPGTRLLAVLAGLAAMPLRGAAFGRALLRRRASASRPARLLVPQAAAILLSLILGGAAALPWALALALLSLPGLAGLLVGRLLHPAASAQAGRHGLAAARRLSGQAL